MANNPNVSGPNVKNSPTQITPPRIKVASPTKIKPKLRAIPSTTHKKYPHTIDSVAP